MAARALVVIDYQNIHLTAHDLFAPGGVPKHETLVHPLHFANQVVQRRNHRVIAAQAAGKEAPDTVELAAVEVYRGQPSNRHDPTAYRRSQAQQSEWTRDRRVQVNYRTLRYFREDGRMMAREKGIDVLVALRVVRAAELGNFDVVILASHDTDLEPALADAASRGTCSVETAGWEGARVLRPGVRLWHTKVGPSEFVSARDRRDYT